MIIVNGTDFEHGMPPGVIFAFFISIQSIFHRHFQKFIDLITFIMGTMGSCNFQLCYNIPIWIYVNRTFPNQNRGCNYNLAQAAGGIHKGALTL